MTLQLVGEAFFHAMAGRYLQACPPASPLMCEYGSTLADFIQGFEPAASVPYLADMARLERLRVCAYHAADHTPLDPQALLQALQGQTRLGDLRVQLHPSVATLDSAYALVAMWAAHQTEGGVATLNPWHAQSALVLRQGLEVKVLATDPGSVAFIDGLGHGLPLQVAVEGALEANAEFDLHQCLTLLISHQAIIHLHLDQKVSP